MPPICNKISSFACLIIFTGPLFLLAILGGYLRSYSGYQLYQPVNETITLIFSNWEAQCYLRDLSDGKLKLKAPSLKSFLRASTAMEDHELRLSGLVVFSNLSDACQPLADVNKAKIQVKKIAFITLANETVCPLQGLVEHAQNAGYSVAVIFLDDLYRYPNRFDDDTQFQDKLLIPVLSLRRNIFPSCRSYTKNLDGIIISSSNIDKSHLWSADRTNIDIVIVQPIDALKKMQEYLRRLYYWFLLGPLITLEWLRRRKKLCCMSVLVCKETAVESGRNRVADHEATRGETKPLLSYCNVRRNGHSRQIAIRRVLTYLKESKLAVSSGYVILIVVALPVGISVGGWSFFRFDENEIQRTSFWDDLITSYHSLYYPGIDWLFLFFDNFLPLWWSPLQIFCFFLYSRFACKTTWTVPTNFSKLIRSDWFSSNTYLLILGVVVPYCTISGYSLLLFSYFTGYNTVCTICNALFVLILNKHKFVTRYVFYISVCMICAYIESDIVAVFYFMLNSKGSLNLNLKLTALRTVAIGLTLTLSFSSSMHIIRKLTKPRESLFEGLGEK